MSLVISPRTLVALVSLRVSKQIDVKLLNLVLTKYDDPTQRKKTTVKSKITCKTPNFKIAAATLVTQTMELPSDR